MNTCLPKRSTRRKWTIFGGDEGVPEETWAELGRRIDALVAPPPLSSARAAVGLTDNGTGWRSPLEEWMT